MKVLFISAEAAPFAKVGGMADVVGSLPKALRQQDIDARILMPGYGFINHSQNAISHLLSFDQPLRSGRAAVNVYTTVRDTVPFYFIQSWPYFGNERTVYTEWDWDVPRFINFNQIIIGAIWALNENLGWLPDVIHVNDWHTGLVPFLIQEAGKHTPAWRSIATLLSIHNLAYQGDHIGGFLWEAGIPGRHHHDLEARDLTDNMLAIAIAYSDIVTTVSPRYATEIQYPYMGYGLDELIRTRAHDSVYGILNGIDLDLWDPETDPNVAENYTVKNFVEKRAINKAHLQRQAGLPENPDTLLIGMVSRLVWQKGIDLAVPALRQFLAGYDAQFVVLGSGEAELEHDLWKLGNDFNWKVRAYLQYNAAAAQAIYAGSDLFLMPSHFEPCGMGQMIAMRYGSLPLVRNTGGLADTVENYDNGNGEHGTGFVFSWEESQAISGTLRWAFQTYTKNRAAWHRMQQRAMQQDFSWDKSAQQYIKRYQQAYKER